MPAKKITMAQSCYEDPAQPAPANFTKRAETCLRPTLCAETRYVIINYTGALVLQNLLLNNTASRNKTQATTHTPTLNCSNNYSQHEIIFQTSILNNKHS